MEMVLDRREFFGVSKKATAAVVVAVASTEVFMLEGCNTDWIQTAINDLPTIVSIATTIATIVADAMGGGLISPAVAAIIKTAAAAAQVGLTLIQQLVKDYQANPSASTIAKIKTTLLDVQAQLGSILDAAHIDNVGLRAIITASVGTAIMVLTQILSLLPAAPAATLTANTKQVAASAVKPLDSEHIKSQLNGFLNAYGYGKYAI
jgi:hypothetical protein